MVRICNNCVDTGDIVLLKQVLELRETSANIVLCFSFMNYLYLSGENGGHGVDAGDITLHEHVLELIDISANIAQHKFHKICLLTALGEDGCHGLDASDDTLHEHVLELSKISATIVLSVNFMN